jgi:hypothetical protein
MNVFCGSLKWIPACAGMTRGWLRRKETNVVVPYTGMTLSLREFDVREIPEHRRPCGGRDPLCDGARATRLAEKPFTGMFTVVLTMDTCLRRYDAQIVTRQENEYCRPMRRNHTEGS